MSTGMRVPMEDSMTATEKPIGYWLKHLHDRIEALFDVVLTNLGVRRRHWQILNLLSRADHTRALVNQSLAPFWRHHTVDTVLSGTDGLITRGWVRHDPATDTLALTDHGRTAHREIASRVGEIRGQLTRGLTAEQYTETVRVLSVMAGNVEAALAEHGAGQTGLVQVIE
jgi:hypothetical protein